MSGIVACVAGGIESCCVAAGAVVAPAAVVSLPLSSFCTLALALSIRASVSVCSAFGAGVGLPGSSAVVICVVAGVDTAAGTASALVVAVSSALISAFILALVFSSRPSFSATPVAGAGTDTPGSVAVAGAVAWLAEGANNVPGTGVALVAAGSAFSIGATSFAAAFSTRSVTSAGPAADAGIDALGSAVVDHVAADSVIVVAEGPVTVAGLSALAGGR